MSTNTVHKPCINHRAIEGFWNLLKRTYPPRIDASPAPHGIKERHDAY